MLMNHLKAYSIAIYTSIKKENPKYFDGVIYKHLHVAEGLVQSIYFAEV